MDQARRQIESQVAALEKEHKRQLADVQNQAEGRVSALEREHKKQMAEIQVKTDRRIATLDEERKAIDQRQKEEMDRIQNEVKAQVAAKSEEHHKQLKHARKTAENDAERVRHRAEADMADLKATISRLEVDLMKVRLLMLVRCPDYDLPMLGQEDQNARDAGTPR